MANCVCNTSDGSPHLGKIDDAGVFENLEQATTLFQAARAILAVINAANEDGTLSPEDLNAAVYAAEHLLIEALGLLAVAHEQAALRWGGR